MSLLAIWRGAIGISGAFMTGVGRHARPVAVAEADGEIQPFAGQIGAVVVGEDAQIDFGMRGGEACRAAGISQPTAKVPTMPTASTLRNRPPSKRSSVAPIVSNACPSTGSSAMPSSVSITPRGRRRNSLTPSRALQRP